MKGFYEDKFEVTCAVGFITHSENGTSYLTEDNYREEREYGYTAECMDDGEWSISFNCTRKLNIFELWNYRPCH